MDVFAAALGADEVAMPQFKALAAVFAAAGQGRCGEGQLCAFGRRALGEKFKTGLKGPGFHAGDEAHLADQFLDAGNGLARMRGIVLTHGLQGKVQQPLDKACLMHGRAVLLEGRAPRGLRWPH